MLVKILEKKINNAFTDDIRERIIDLCLLDYEIYNFAKQNFYNEVNKSWITINVYIS